MESFSFHEPIDYNPYYNTVPALVKVLYIFLFLLLETLGNFLLYCLVIYEKYGMDAQKRTVTNQLLSKVCIVTLFYNIIAMPLAMVHRIGYSSIASQSKN